MTTLLFIMILVVAMIAAMAFAPQGWRTVAANAAVAVPVLALQLSDFLIHFNFGAILSPSEAAWLMLALNVLNIFLRSITSTPMGKRP